MKILKVKGVKIGGFHYSVDYVPTSFDMGAMNRIGECDYINQKISIHEHLHPDQQIEVFLHEIVHAITKIYDIPMPEDEDTEEQIVERFGKALLQVRMDNKLLNPVIFSAPKVAQKKKEVE